MLASLTYCHTSLEQKYHNDLEIERLVFSNNILHMEFLLTFYVRVENLVKIYCMPNLTNYGSFQMLLIS